LERSVCDAVKYRNKLGLDVCAEVIRSESSALWSRLASRKRS